MRRQTPNKLTGEDSGTWRRRRTYEQLRDTGGQRERGTETTMSYRDAPTRTAEVKDGSYRTCAETRHSFGGREQKWPLAHRIPPLLVNVTAGKRGYSDSGSWQTVSKRNQGATTSRKRGTGKSFAKDKI